MKGTTKRTLINKDANKAYYVLGMTDGVGFYNAAVGSGDDVAPISSPSENPPSTSGALVPSKVVSSTL